MKKIISAMFIMFAISIPSISSAQKVGFVNINVLFAEYDKANGVKEKIEAQFGDKQKELEKLGSSIKALDQEIKTNELLMTESKLASSKKKRNEMLMQLRQKEMAFKNELQEAQSVEMGKFRKVIMDIINAYGKEKSYDIIFNDGIIYVSDAANITDDIKKRMAKIKAKK